MRTRTKSFRTFSAPRATGLGGAVTMPHALTRMRTAVTRAAATLALVMITTAATWAQSAFSGGDGSEDDPYRIASAANLDQLASDVNGGNAYSGKYFKMTADISYAYSTAWNSDAEYTSNYTAIGNRLGNSTTQENPFSGTFDGDGHTVSGIRIYKNGGSGWADYFSGIFGFVLNGTVRNVTLADARLTGRNSVGGIVGSAIADEGTCTIDNCHVLSNVAIHAVADGSSSHGGIAGTTNGATVSHCTSAATLTIKDGVTGCEAYGGIVGNTSSATLRHNYAIGVTMPAVTNAGAIVGKNYSNTTEYNYYSGCAVGSNTSGIGYGWGDITTDPDDPSEHPDGAVPLDATMLSETADVPALTAGEKVAFYREFAGGKSSTVCLPFAYTPAAGIGAFYEFGGVDDEKTTVTMNATGDNPLQANKPYLFVPAAGGVVFHGDAADDISAGSTTEVDWQFTGTYATIEWATDPTTIYGFASGEAYGGASDDTEAGTFIRVRTGGIRPMRAYLEYIGGSSARAVTRGNGGTLPDVMTVRLVSRDGQTTAIGTLDTRSGEADFYGWYSLGGQRLSGKPSQKGIYIHNGKKEVLR